MSCVKFICFALILIVLCLKFTCSSDKMTIDTFESTDKRLILLRTSRHVNTKVILLKRRLRKLIQRRKLHYTRLKSAKSRKSLGRLKDKLRGVQKSIKKLRRQLIKQRKGKNEKMFKSSSTYEVQAAFTYKNVKELRELHEKCKNQGCSQLCTPQIDPTGTNCHCHRGFHLDPRDNKTCLDINECKLSTTKCEFKCVNTMGSHYCACPPGKKLSYDKSTCIDINECFLNNNHGPCQDGCVNSEASYSCTCDRFSGTRLSQDGHSCGDIDECEENLDDCSHDCFNIYNSFVCGCPLGMVLGDDDKTCLDINECRQFEIQKSCRGKCINTIGSYFCLDNNNLNKSDLTCEQLPPSKDGYYLCNRNDTVRVILKGITDREHFLNSPGTVCTYHTSLHVPTKSHVCNDRARWEDYPLTIISNSLNVF